MNRLLIANRGEIAARIIRTCRDLGIRTVAVYSDADRDAPFVALADTAVYLGGSDPRDSYLHVEALLAAAARAGADAVHPGYGFLSEQAAFARACQAAGLTWVGPHPDAIEAMGDKARAKALMAEHGVPVIPGYTGEDQSEAALGQAAAAIGFPVLLKAAAGGGGKGMRVVHHPAEMAEALAAARREAAQAFGDDRLILEKFFPRVRHVEFQIFGDKHGQAIHLMERECSLQRRYQKVVEESPSPALTPELRARMGAAAVQAAQALRYDNAGTVEFILTPEGDFFFLEVNTRLQVEHPVTEAILGLDLVRWQIEVAEGAPLPLRQEAIQPQGYALECRLYAEDAAQGFLPMTGRILRWEPPAVPGLRVETGVASGSEISRFYDPMIAKLILHGPDRASVHRRMRYALDQLVCLGTQTNQGFLQSLLARPAVVAGDYDTRIMEREGWGETAPTDPFVAALVACLHSWWQRDQRRALLASLPSGWRNNFYQPQQESWQVGELRVDLRYRYQDGRFQVESDDRRAEVRLLAAGPDHLRLEVEGRVQAWSLVWETADRCYLQQGGSQRLDRLPRYPLPEASAATGTYTAPMPGQVLKVLVQPEQTVAEGEVLLILTSMKMEHRIVAHAAGRVETVAVQAGDTIEAGAALLVLHPVAEIPESQG